MGIKGFRKSAEFWHDSDVGLSLAIQIYCASTMPLDLDAIFFSFNVLEATVCSCLAGASSGEKKISAASGLDRYKSSVLPVLCVKNRT